MTGTDLCVNKPHLFRSYFNHLILRSSYKANVILVRF